MHKINVWVYTWFECFRLESAKLAIMAEVYVKPPVSTLRGVVIPKNAILSLH
jgi:hypothetical protein